MNLRILRKKLNYTGVGTLREVAFVNGGLGGSWREHCGNTAFVTESLGKLAGTLREHCLRNGEPGEAGGNTAGTTPIHGAFEGSLGQRGQLIGFPGATEPADRIPWGNSVTQGAGKGHLIGVPGATGPADNSLGQRSQLIGFPGATP